MKQKIVLVSEISCSMAGMKSSKMSVWVLNMHEMGWMGDGLNKLLNKLSKAEYIIVSVIAFNIQL